MRNSDPRLLMLLLAGGGARYSPEASALFAAMTAQPDASRKALIDQTIRSLKNASLWYPKLNGLVVCAAHDAQAGLIDWITPSRVCTAVSNPSFTVDQGYTGNGTSSYLDSNFNPTTDANATATQNSNHLGLVVLNNVASNSGIGNAKQSIQPRSSVTNDFAGRAGNTSNTVISAGISTDSRGHFVVTRNGDANNISGYINGALVATVAATSAVLDNSNFWIGSKNLNNFSTYQVAIAHWGEGLTGAEIATLYSILNGAKG